METHHYWEENGHATKYENYNPNDDFGRATGDQINFTAPSEDEAEYPSSAFIKKGKVSRQDPMSHRIIEKRRRDRMNNCLTDLSRLIPPEYLKKGRGRVEKTEIIEMAIRHLKFLQDSVNAAERQVAEEPFRVGYQEAVSEAVRFLVDVQGFGPSDGLCVQLASHLQRHCEIVTKAGSALHSESTINHLGSSSEAISSSSSSLGYTVKGVLQRQEPPPVFPDPYEQERPQELTYHMECDTAQRLMSAESSPPEEPLPLDGRHKREPTLRKVRKPDHVDDYLHSYKFKNSIERRFSRSQDSEVAESGRVFTKRRRAIKEVPASTSASASTSGSTEDTRDTSPQGEDSGRCPAHAHAPMNLDTSSESPHHHYEKPSAPAQQCVPVFALDALGKYYVPLTMDWSCVARAAGGCGLDSLRSATPLHPVTIHVNFQPCIDYHSPSIKCEPVQCDRERDCAWRPV